MNAVVVSKFGGPEVLEYRQVEKPVAAVNQVVIRVSGTSVNFADVKSRYGGKGSNPPFIPGMDCAGTIVEVGADVKELRVGQRVIAFPHTGSYAEYVTANAELTFALPDQIDDQTAAACPLVSFTSYKLLADVGQLETGETVLIHAAAGGIGTTAIQLAKIMGAGRVIGVVSSEEKAATALEAGADVVINSTKDDFGQAVLDLTQGRGADVILDSIGGSVSEQSLSCLAMYGRLVAFGNSSGRYAAIDTKDLHASCRSVRGFSLGTTRKQRPYLLRKIAENVLPLLAEKRLTIKVGHTFSLDQAPAAHTLMESRQSRGKILLIPAALR